MTIDHRAHGVVTSPRNRVSRSCAATRRPDGARVGDLLRDVAYAAIVDRAASVVAHSDPARVGERLPDGDDLAVAGSREPASRSCARCIRPIGCSNGGSRCSLDDVPFAEIRIGLSTLLVRDELDAWLGRPR